MQCLWGAYAEVVRSAAESGHARFETGRRRRRGARSQRHIVAGSHIDVGARKSIAESKNSSVRTLERKMNSLGGFL